MKKFAVVILTVVCLGGLRAEDEPALDPNAPDDGFLALEGGLGYNTYDTSRYFKAPIAFTGGSGNREIAMRLLLLSDAVNAGDYFSGNNSFVRQDGIYPYSFGTLDIDYLSWYGKIWSLGFGLGMGHQGFLISGADKTAHAVIGRLRGQGFLYLWEYLATQLVVTWPIAFYQSVTDNYRLGHAELNVIFDFKGRVRNPEPQSFMFAVSLQYDYVHINHPLRMYLQHEFTPMLKAWVTY
jgi:hypothetical protein